MSHAGPGPGPVAALVLALVALLVAGCTPARTAAGDGLTTVFVGDSITWGGTSDFDGRPGVASWVRYAAAGPRSPWAYRANVAVSGETLGEMRDRFGSDVLDREPEAVVLMGGTNDLFQGVPRRTSLADLRWMVEAARDTGARVWVVGFPPVDDGDVDWRGLLAAEERLAAELEVPFLRTDRAVLDPATGRWRPGLTSDGLHPNPAGARTIAESVLEQLAAG